MAYASNDELPPAVRRLPAHALDVCREAFHHARARHDGDGTCRRIARAAVGRGDARPHASPAR